MNEHDGVSWNPEADAILATLPPDPHAALHLTDLADTADWSYNTERRIRELTLRRAS